MFRGSLASLVALALLLVRADVITQQPDAAPPGFEMWESPIVLPAPPVQANGDWADALTKARAFVGKLTLEEKVNLTTGVGTVGRCVGNTGTVPRLNFNGFCLEDSPAAVRFTDHVSVFVTPINAAATFDQELILKRGLAMGTEHRGKGVNVALAPMTNIGRVAAGGRNWEGFGGDPYLASVATGLTVKGYQDNGVIACVKHFVANEQEHMRGGSLANQIYSSNVDDRTLHEVYAFPFAMAIKQGVGCVMCSYNKVNQTQACQNSKLINGVLKEELGYRGFVTSDWAAVINGVQPAVAGIDMNMPGFRAYGLGVSDPNPDNTTNSFWGSELIKAVKNGSVPEARLDDMVTRTMGAFFKMGQDKNYPTLNFDYNTEDTFVDGVLVNEHVNVQGDHAELIREMGAASAVLLKNVNETLPLDAKNIKRMAIIGSDAGSNPDGPNGCGDRGCDQGTLALGWGSGTAQFPYLVDPLSAIQSYVLGKNPKTTVEYVLNDYNYWQVTNIASHADTCIVFTNADSGEGYIDVEGNQGDRNDLELWHAGATLINKTASVCANTIVVVHAVGPVNYEPFIGHPNVKAVLSAGLPGQESGNSITDVLFGAVNPSGRLPYTVAKARADYPADVVYSSDMQTPQFVYKEALQIDYRWFDGQNIEPRFEFGFGLSYTTFEYSNLHVQTDLNGGHEDDHKNKRAVTSAARATATAAAATPNPASGKNSVSSPAAAVSASKNDSTTSGGASVNASTTNTALGVISSPVAPVPGGPTRLWEDVVTVTFDVKNTGRLDGHEVTQLYLGFPEGAGEPPKVLRGFQRSMVTRGSTVHVTLKLKERDISIWNVVKQDWEIPSGKFSVWVGASSRDIRLSGAFTA